MNKMVEYCMLETCRHIFISKYFNPDEGLSKCGNCCDVCVDLEGVRKRKSEALEGRENTNDEGEELRSEASHGGQMVKKIKDGRIDFGGFQTAREVYIKGSSKSLGARFQTAGEFHSMGKKKSEI
jgi:superfamily II DNA helicase RecQ